MSDSSSSWSATASEGFDVVCIPIGEYLHSEDHPPLPADEEAELLVELLSELGGKPDPWQLTGESRDGTAVNARLAHWSQVEWARNSMLLWVGHGESAGRKASLAAYDSRPGTGVTPEDFAHQIAQEWGFRWADAGAWTIVVIEACGARAFVQLLDSALKAEGRAPERLALVGSGSDGAGFLGDFRHALAGALGEYTENDKLIKPSDLVNRVGYRLHEGWVATLAMHTAWPIKRARLLEGTITAPVDTYTELRDFLRNLSPDERGHFVPKAQSAEQGELAWYFVGRAAEREKIAHWLRTKTSGILVVTGRAGAGKSALLGNMLIHTNPALRDLLSQTAQFEPIPDQQRPPDEVFDAVVHLTGMTTSELVRRLADAAGLPPSQLTGQSRPDIEALLTELAERPFCLLADALDEAQEPATIASAVLQRIARLPMGRVVIGTRRSTREGPDQPDTTTAEDLLDALGRERSTVVDVKRDPEAITTYVRRRLADEAIDDSIIERVTELISEQKREFLFARLAVHEVVATPALLEVKRSRELRRMLSNDHRRLFAAAVDRLTQQAPANRALLEALALSEGRGLPRADRIWAIFASTLVDGIGLTASSIDDLLRDAAPYVMLDAEHGQSVYRLAHQTFKEHFLARYERRQAKPSLPERHRLITRALIEAAERALPAPPNPYLVHHLSTHVAIADEWDFLAKCRLLEHLDPVDVIVRRARTLLHRGRPNAAEHELRVALIREPQHVESHTVLAIALSRQAEHAAALAEAKEAIRLAPDWWYPHYIAGTVLHGAHREDDALRAARAAQYFDPRVPSIWILLAKIHMAREEWQLSAQAAREGLTHDPHNSELVSLMTMALSEIAGAPGAMANAEEAVRLGPEDPLAHLAYGYAALAIRDTDKAVGAFQEALRLDPSMDVAREQLVEALKQRNPVYRGLDWLLKAIASIRIPPIVLIPLFIFSAGLLLLLFGLIATMRWAQWTADALLTWRLSRDPRHRRIVCGNDLHAAWLSILALVLGAAMLVGGIAFSHPGTGFGAAGLATLALVTPIQETFATPAQPARRILGCWTALLVVVLATLLGIAVMPASPDEFGAYPVCVMLAALVSVWVAAAIRWVFKRRHRRLTL